MSNTDRDRAILWARQMLEQEFVVLDTETTGLDYDDVAVQIGIVNRDGAILLDTYVKPWKPIPARATQLHGITDEMVKGAPTILELEPQLAAALQGQVVLIYNAEYDANILRRSFLYSGAEKHGAPYRLPETHWTFWGIFKPECAMEAFAAFYGDFNARYGTYRWQKLTTAAAHFGLSVVGAHGAVQDALTTLAVVKKMAESKLSAEEETL